MSGWTVWTKRHEELLSAAKGYSCTRHAWLNSPISCMMLYIIRSCFCTYEEDQAEQTGFQWVQCVYRNGSIKFAMKK